MKLKEILIKFPLILTEGAVIERIKREFSYKLDESIANAEMVYSKEGKTLLEKIYRQYLDIAKIYDLPIFVFTPTWRANPERLKNTGFKDINVNSDCFDFLSKIRASYGTFSKKILIGGLIGCKGDAYKPEESLITEDAYSFHKTQISALANAGVDFIFASTLPSLSEALGIAKAITTLNAQYLLSFIIRPNGDLLDGNSLSKTISTIDGHVSVKPMCYMINCIHPTIFRAAITNNMKGVDLIKKRLIGLQANTSSKSPEELNSSLDLDSEKPEIWSKEMLSLYEDFRIKILGGCCGTNQHHIQSLAMKMNQTKNDL